MRFFFFFIFCTSVLLLSCYCTTSVLLYSTRPQTWSIAEGRVGWRQKSSRWRTFSLGSYLGAIGSLVSSFWWSPKPAKQLQVLLNLRIVLLCTTTVLLLAYYGTTTVLLLSIVLLYYYCTTTVLLLYYYGTTTVLLHQYTVLILYY